MSVTTRTPGKAQEIARKLMVGWDVGDLEHLMTEHVSADEDRELLSQIEPQYDAMDAEASKIYSELQQQLDRQTGKDALGRYAEIQLELNNAYRQAGFHLGFAAALELLGVDGRGSPEEKAWHLKGDRS